MGLWCGDGLGFSLLTSPGCNHTSPHYIILHHAELQILQMQDILAHCEACVQDIALILQV